MAGSEQFRQVLVAVDDGGGHAGVVLPVLQGARAAVEDEGEAGALAQRAHDARQDGVAAGHRQQVVPHTFLRTRLFNHVFGADTADHRQAATTIQYACERLQADRAAGILAMGEGGLMADFHRRLAVVYTCEGAAN